MGSFVFLLSGCYLLPLADTPSGWEFTQTLSSSTATANIKETLTPTFTSTNTPEISSTATTTHSVTPAYTATNTIFPTATQTRTPTPVIAIYKLQTGVPVYTRNFAHPESGCNWMGVAGQIFDISGKPAINLVVNVKGSLGTLIIDEVAISGIPGADIYGPGSFEIKLSGNVLTSQNNLRIQLFDLNGKPLSAEIPFSTFADCSKNLIIVNFVPNQP